MASVKIVLRQKQNKDNTYPLAIRITKDRKTSFIHLGKSILDTQWDAKEQRVRKNHPNSSRMNNFLITKLAEATEQSLELETLKKDFSSRVVKQKIKPAGGSTFFPQAEIYLKNLELSGKYNRYVADKPRVTHFKEFAGDKALTFADITVSFLEQYKIYLKSTYNNSERTIINNLSVIRSVFSQAIKAGITDVKYYPFGSAGKIQIKFPVSMKIGLAAAEVQLIENVDLSLNANANHARNLWLFSFYLAGMRISDVFRLKWSDIHNGRLHYTMGKNAKGGSFELPQKALAILDQYLPLKTDRDDLIFPDLKKLDDLGDKFTVQKNISFATGRIDKILRKQVAPAAGIDKKLTMHIARHTFGNIAGDKINIQMLQNLYRHSNIQTTVGYQANFIHKNTDDALAAVVNFNVAKPERNKVKRQPPLKTA
jgi:integrase/recombinase XerD